MSKIYTIFLIISLLFIQVNAKEYSCTSSILIEQKSREIIEGKNIYHMQSVASISKIMTAIIAIENLDVTKEIIIPPEVSQAYGSAVYIKQNEKITILDLLYATLLRSGNDSAIVLSLQLDDFIDLMNHKAQQLGMKYTTFNNPTGLDELDDGNISCVYDMAILMAYAMDNSLFRQIIMTKKYERLDGQGYWTNKNKLLFNYEYCTGGKTGYTKRAGRTLITSAKKGNLELICVTIRCIDDFSMHKDLYDLYFKKYEYFFDLDRF